MFRVGLVCFALFVWLSLVGRAAEDLPWSAGTGFRSRELHPGTSGKAGFTLMAPQATAVRFTITLEGDLYLTNAVAHNGAGLAIGDVDGDGWPDVYFCNLQGPNRLYRNLGGWHFEEMDVGEAACADQLSTGTAFADVDGDGDLDLLVSGIARGTRLFLNDGKGRWTELKNSGLSRTASPTSMALADIDGDGDLDLYCAHYIDVMHLADPTTRFALARRGDKWEVTKVNGESTRLPRWKDRFEALPDGKVRELPEVHGLYRNDGHGHFAPIQFEPGVFLNEQGAPIPPYRDWGLGVMFRDMNGDGAPDFYVCNDFASPDRIWINSGQGTFRAIDPLKFRHTSRSAMGLDFADIDRDGYDDLIVVDMLAREHGKRMTQLVKDPLDPQILERVDGVPAYNRNMLFFGRPDGSYVEGALMAGVAATDWSWCPIFIDVDLDGFEDLLVTNGFEFDAMDRDSFDRIRGRKLTEAQLKRSRQFYPRWPTQNAAFRNRHDGTFEPMNSWGFNRAGVSYGMALGDLDNDGDLDVVVNNLNGVASLYRNDAPAGRIGIRLKGLPPNTQGIGARIRLVGGSLTQSQEMICGGRYMSSDQAMRVFAADPDPAKPMQVEVTWRNGKRSVVTNASPNRIYEIAEDSALSGGAPTDHGPRTTDETQSPKSKVQGPRSEDHVSRFMFQDVSELISHTHHDDSFDDWARQPMLPRRLSRLGPGVGWYDLDGDGWEDLIVAAGRGGRLTVFANEQGQKFRGLEGARPSLTDQGAVLGWPDGKGNRSLLVAVSNFEVMADHESEISTYSLTNLGVPQHLRTGKASPGPMAAADIDGDGDLDLFVGGRFRPGAYPEPVSSAIWLNEQGELRPSLTLSGPFQSAGLVSGATFADLDGDGDPDLALAVEWGPIRIFLNEAGTFKSWDAPVTLTGERSTLNSQPLVPPKRSDGGSTLNHLSGWWTSITAGDFDGDGKMDLAVGNWGRNTAYELYRPGPWRVYYGDWNGDGIVELIEAWPSAGRWLPVRDRLWLARGLPELLNRFPTHEAFGQANIQDILGSNAPKAKWTEVTTLDSGVFLNRGSRFDWAALPRAAQLSPVFSVNTGDCDGDGIEDLFLSQNFFGSALDLSRDDSGRGLWLRGQGDGRFTAMDASLTGIKVEGEQRGAALADFNHDGRVDLVVSQNNGPTKLYVNRGAKRGLRVALQGPPSNPDAIGAQMRVLYANGRTGPGRTVQAGSGYWSQDGTAQVLGCSAAPSALWIRWPGGKEQTLRVEENHWDLRVNSENER